MNPERPSVPAMLRKGRSLVTAGRMGPAFQIAQGLVKEAPGDVRGYLLAAAILKDSLRVRAALNFTARGLALAPGHKQLALMNAELLRLAGESAASLVAYEVLAKTYAWSEPLRVELAIALLGAGQIEQALPMLEDAYAHTGTLSRVALKSLIIAHVCCGNLARARYLYGRLHLATHRELLAAAPESPLASRLVWGSARAFADCGRELAALAKGRESSPVRRAFLHAAGDQAGLSADRSFYFPSGARDEAVARLDALLASPRSTRPDAFIDGQSSMLGLTYRTTNLGDDVQSLAVLNLTGKVKALVDRDRLDEDGPSGKVVLNGWWGHHRSFPIATRDLSVAWPPRSGIDPLFISFHLDPLRAAMYLTAEGVAFLKRHEPIGCRDHWTESLLRRRGIQAYFSGCLTLTLPRYDGPRTERILLVDLPHRAMPHVRQAVARYCNFRQKALTHEIVRFTTDPIRRLGAARFALQHYARSACVVTTRLHVALPCVAMGTPVLFLQRDARDRRFDGLSELVYAVSLADAMEDDRIFDPARWPTKTAHLALRQDLIDAVRSFVDGRPKREPSTPAPAVVGTTESEHEPVRGRALHP